MIRHALVPVAALALSACDDDSPSFSIHTSPGGIEYTLLDMPGQEYVTVQVAWPTDWAYREGLNKAAPHVGAQLILTGGADGYPAGVAGERFADLDSSGDIYVAANDHVIGELTFRKESVSETVGIANAHLRSPTLDEAWFRRIRDGMAKDMAEAQAQPAHSGFDAVRWALFGGQPLRNALSLDAPDTFTALTRPMVASWHARTFTRSPDIIVVAGEIPADAAGTALDTLFEGLPESRHDHVRDASPDLTPRRILLHLPEASVTNLAFIAPLPPTDQGGEIEDFILSHALGGDHQSVLFETVRTTLRASYGFGAGISNYTRRHRILFMAGEVAPERLADAESEIRKAYAEFRRTGPGGELDGHRERLRADFTSLSDSPVRQARAELQSALDGHPPGHSLMLAATLEAVTEASVAGRLAKDFPEPEDFTVIAVSPDADVLPGACVILHPRDAGDCP